ncbi:MAG: extracellular solute-binding protein, partial [Clostridia bacterium]|nr:extracellular solute-binding protein [Clostridia bacterium]
MKKLLAFLLMAAMLLSSRALVGCNVDFSIDTNPNENVGEEGTDAGQVYEVDDELTYTGEEVTIKFYHTMGANLREVLDAYIVEFNKLYPNIKIEHSQVGSYDDVRNQISTEITVGNQPHIAYCYPDHVALYNSAKAVVTLDGLIGSKATVTRADGTTEILGLTDEQKADFIEGYYNEGKQFG